MDAAALIKVARRAAGFSQSALASRARTSQQTIADYEHGRKQPGAATLARIVRACGFELGLSPVGPAQGPRRLVLDQRRSTILQIARRHGASNVRAFGSVARGDDTDASDIDLLVDLRPGRRLLALAGLRWELTTTLDVAVDVATVEMLRPEAREQALREAILV